MKLEFEQMLYIENLIVNDIEKFEKLIKEQEKSKEFYKEDSEGLTEVENIISEWSKQLEFKKQVYNYIKDI